MDSDNDSYQDEEYTYEDYAEYGDEEEDEVVDQSFSPVGLKSVHMADGGEEGNGFSPPGNAKRLSSISTGGSKGSRSSTGSSSSKAPAVLVVPDDSYIIADCTEVKPLMNCLVNEVSSLLDLNTDMTQTLLHNNKWDKEKLVDIFFADSDRALKDAGLDLFSQELISLALYDERSEEAEKSSGKMGVFRCRICCDCCDVGTFFSLGCGHKFCRPCYSEYLRNQVNDGPSCIQAHCPEHKCSQAVTKSVFRALLVNPEDAVRYDLYYIKNFIEVSKAMKYCPAPRCDKVAIGSGITTVRCSCTYPFCFRCGEEAHDPCSCRQLVEWNEKCMNESETANWILANTRKCPNCMTRIEKNQGCNHMACKLCKHEFCWICMGVWSEHGQSTGGFYKCNRFDAGNINTQVDAAQKAKAELDRYLHYYQRFHGHDTSLKYASGQREQAEKRMVEQQESQKSSWIDVQFLKQAAEQVIDCRRVLKYTYVMGFSLIDSSPEKQLFEHHQEMLEKNTEKLHEYTEQPLDQLDRPQVVNLTRVTERFMASLLASMTGGVVSMTDDNMNGSLGVLGVSGEKEEAQVSPRSSSSRKKGSKDSEGGSSMSLRKPSNRASSKKAAKGG